MPFSSSPEHPGPDRSGTGGGRGPERLSPTHPSRRQSARLDDAFDRLVRQDRLLARLAHRHWLQHDLRMTAGATLGPLLVGLLTGHLAAATATAAGLGGVVLLAVWVEAEHGLHESIRLLTVVRWGCVGLVMLGCLVALQPDSGPRLPATTGPDRTQGRRRALGSICTG